MTTADKYHRKNREAFNDWKKTLACSICGEDDPDCIDFHHRDPSDNKKLDIGRICGQNLESVLKEVSKCDILCSNCHRKLHAKLKKELEVLT